MRRFTVRTLAAAALLCAGLATFPAIQHALAAQKTAPAKMAKASAQAAAPAAASTTPQMTSEDVSAFFDGMVPQEIQRDDIGGAVIAVIRDNQVIFAKGYGYADVKDKKPVSPEETLFRVGSISKLFTWTAVMQLVEERKIDLDADINQYLDFHIPATFGKPITMRDLMTHTPGFEEAIKDLITSDSTKIPPIGDYLKTHLPKQIFPPGTIGAYSNYGATLAGYIVQRVSGEDFYAYIEHHIFESLGITHASFRQPLPANLQPLMSDGYQLASGGAKPFEIVTAAPAGSLAISAMDITRFMIAHLNNGTYMRANSGANVQMNCPRGVNCSGASAVGAVQILSPEIVKEMHARQYAPDAHVNGMCLGFYEESYNGHRIIGHGGDTVYFHSDLHLIQDANVGFFISFNSAGRGESGLRGPFFRQFMERYFPYTPPATPATATAAADAKAVSGTYLPSRRPQTNLFYLFALLGESAVSPGKDNTLIVEGANGLNGQPIQWHEAEPNVWYNPANPQSKIVFKTGSNGCEEMDAEFPAELMQQVPWYESQNFIAFCGIFAVGIFALTLLLWPIAAMVRWHYGWKVEGGERELRSRARARVVCAVNLVFWAAFVGLFMLANGHLSILSSSADPWLRGIQVIGWIGVIGTLWAIWNFFVSVFASGRWWWARVHDTLILLACFVSLWLIWFTHLLSFSLNY